MSKEVCMVLEKIFHQDRIWGNSLLPENLTYGMLFILRHSIVHLLVNPLLIVPHGVSGV